MDKEADRVGEIDCENVDNVTDVVKEGEREYDDAEIESEEVFDIENEKESVIEMELEIEDEDERLVDEEKVELRESV